MNGESINHNSKAWQGQSESSFFFFFFFIDIFFAKVDTWKLKREKMQNKLHSSSIPPFSHMYLLFPLCSLLLFTSLLFSLSFLSSFPFPYFQFLFFLLFLFLGSTGEEFQQDLRKWIIMKPNHRVHKCLRSTNELIHNCSLYFDMTLFDFTSKFDRCSWKAENCILWIILQQY